MNEPSNLLLFKTPREAWESYRQLFPSDTHPRVIEAAKASFYCGMSGAASVIANGMSCQEVADRVIEESR